MTDRVRAAPPQPSAGQLARWGLDPAWSTFLSVPSHDGPRRTWHVLDTAPEAVGMAAVRHRLGSGPPTVVCIHGNPTWSWAWASFLHRLSAAGHRVIAPDLLGMGYSARTPDPRPYERRVADLDDLLAGAGVVGEIVLVGHDWGGAIAMGWAVRHPERVAAMVLANTGIAVPAGRSAPRLIRVAAMQGIHSLVTRRSPLFVRGTARLSGARLGPVEREALRAPYRRAAHRSAIGDFVADVPFDESHPSSAAIDGVADALGSLEAPVLLLWGGRDPVFDDDFAGDLLVRFRTADVHRFPTAGHLVVPETAGDGVPGPSAAEVAENWLAEVLEPAGTGGVAASGAAGSGAGRVLPAVGLAGSSDAELSTGPVPAAPSTAADRPVWAAIGERALADPDVVAFHDDATGRSVSFAELDRRVAAAVVGLADRGLRRGDRVALLVPPSVELVTVVYACWRLGLVTVIADRGLGLGGLGRAVRGSRVDALIGPRRALVAARTLRWAPSARRVDVDELLTVVDVGSGLVGLPDDRVPPRPDDLAAVLFTSGATGPAKGVRYTHRRLAGQRDALTALYGIGPDDRFVAAFAPFALYGPALGITSAVPDVDVTAPGRLTAEVLDRACAAVGATMVFASPAALANVVRTASGPLPALASVRTVMSAGAPVPVRTLRAVSALAPGAELHTPYGMTEALPVADIDLAGIEASQQASPADGVGGVCVGTPAPGCRVLIAPLDLLDDLTERRPSSPDDPPPVLPEVAEGVTGEILVSSPWMSAGYDGAWLTQRAARPVDPDGVEWHRSGDVGHLDPEGRLWVEGRLAHVVRTVDGAVTPVPVEVVVERIEGVERAAAVGVGPAGVQQLVVVVEIAGRARRPLADLRLAPVELAEQVRSSLGQRAVAAVLVTSSLPVDIRHNAKIDRSEVARRAAAVLAGSAS